MRATDDSGFELRLYYDVTTHRLAASDDVALPPYHGEVLVRPGKPVLPQPPRQPDLENTVIERYSYGEYRRAGNIWFPHVMTRVIPAKDGAPGVPQFLHVTHVAVNPRDVEKQFARD